MEDFQAQFQAYGGNYQETMSRFLDNEATYLKIFSMLFQDENRSKLKHTLECGDLSGAFEAAHTLKGVAGNLGLTPLYQSVCAMVAPLRQKQELDYGQLLRAVEQQFERVEALYQSMQAIHQ